MCNGIDSSHWSVLSKCFKVHNNLKCVLNTPIVTRPVLIVTRLRKKMEKVRIIEVFGFQLLCALQPDLNWFWMRHEFGLDIF